jgi:hypothetical protein
MIIKALLKQFRDRYGIKPPLEVFISKVYKSGREEVLTEAIAIFDKYKNEPMTGNVVNLELKGLRRDYK